MLVSLRGYRHRLVVSEVKGWRRPKMLLLAAVFRLSVSVMMYGVPVLSLLARFGQFSSKLLVQGS